MNLKKIMSALAAMLVSITTMATMASAAVTEYNWNLANATAESGTVDVTYYAQPGTAVLATEVPTEGEYLTIYFNNQSKNSVDADSIYWRNTGSYIEYTPSQSGYLKIVAKYSVGLKANGTTMELLEIDTAAADKATYGVEVVAGTKYKVNASGSYQRIYSVDFLAEKPDLGEVHAPATVERESTSVYYWDESEGKVASGTPEDEDVVRLKGVSYEIKTNDDTIVGIKISNQNTKEKEQTIETNIAPGSTITFGAFAITTEGSKMSQANSGNWTLEVDKGDGNYIVLE